MWLAVLEMVKLDDWTNFLSTSHTHLLAWGPSGFRYFSKTTRINIFVLVSFCGYKGTELLCRIAEKVM
tara:strand:+ start:360 stop:563 length:204 start_codon:yes stop_codon:yes gene_type:complete